MHIPVLQVLLSGLWNGRTLECSWKQTASFSFIKVSFILFYTLLWCWMNYCIYTFANRLEHQSHPCNMYNQIVWCKILIYLLHTHTHTHTHVFLYVTCTNSHKYTYLRTYLVFCCEDAFISSFVVPFAQALGRNCRFLQPKGSAWTRGCVSSSLVPSLKLKRAWPCPWPSDSVWSASNLNLYSYLRSWDFYVPNRNIFSTVQ